MAPRYWVADLLEEVCLVVHESQKGSNMRVGCGPDFHEVTKGLCGQGVAHPSQFGSCSIVIMEEPGGKRVLVLQAGRAKTGNLWQTVTGYGTLRS